MRELKTVDADLLFSEAWRKEMRRARGVGKLNVKGVEVSGRHKTGGTTAIDS